MPQDTLKVPELSLILLMGSSGAGKSTFARRLFKPTEIVSSDVCRGLVADEENDQSASGDAFELLQATLTLNSYFAVNSTNRLAITR